MSKRRIEGVFAPRLIEMLESPAYKVLSRAAHQVLARIEIEHARHGGHDNGRLPVTFDQFVEYGIHRHAIAPAIRELVALGFTEITQQGRAGNADWCRPTLYRITYRDSLDQKATHNWRSITEDDAEMIAKGARRRHSNSAAPRRRPPVTVSAKPSDENRHWRPVTKTATAHPKSPVAETVTTSRLALQSTPPQAAAPTPVPRLPADPWADIGIPDFLRRHARQ
jgi:hypothetical protein